MTQLIKTNTVPISRNLLLQAIAYFKQHDDPMAKMLAEQIKFALSQEDSQSTQGFSREMR